MFSLYNYYAILAKNSCSYSKLIAIKRVHNYAYTIYTHKHTANINTTHTYTRKHTHTHAHTHLHIHLLVHRGPTHAYVQILSMHSHTLRLLAHIHTRIQIHVHLCTHANICKHDVYFL